MEPTWAPGLLLPPPLLLLRLRLHKLVERQIAHGAKEAVP
jgi:hypothetical protein